MSSYAVTHRTRYRYAEEVAASYGLAHLLPRDTPGQRCLQSRLDVTPVPEQAREHHDFFGNRMVHFQLHEPHRELEVVAHSVVEVAATAIDTHLLSRRAWESVRDTVRGGTDPVLLDARAYALDSPLVHSSTRMREFAAPSFPPHRPAVEAVVDLCGRIHHDFEFDPSATDVSTTAEELLDAHGGVCQDFAHLMIGCLRSLGLPARYVSGYLETDPPPDRPRLQGSDVSHAWASVHLPEVGWLDLDPTNDQVVGDRHVTTAWGRDYADVTPLKGVIFTDGTTEELTVEVDVVRRDAA